MKKYFLGLLIAMSVSGFYSCDREEGGLVEPISNKSDSTRAIINWVYNIMNRDYLWRSTMPNIDRLKESSVEVYFKKLINTNVDHWSYITNDFEGMMKMLNNESLSYGFSFELYLAKPNRYEVVGVVEYVVPNSPASEVGLKRGDIFGYINNTKIMTTNYQNLLAENGYQLTLMKADTTEVTGFGKIKEMPIIIPREFKENPILLDSIYNYQGKKVGYFHYTGFISSPQDDANMVNVFKKFETQKIDELILDLRYNGGGSTTTATQLASMITTKENADSKKVFFKYIWNEPYNNQFLETEGPSSPNLVSKFVSMPVHLGMKRVFVLALEGTASASELIINGLDPYLDVQQIGKNTHGKYTVMMPYCANEKFDKEAIYEPTFINKEVYRHNYGLLPIVAKSANANNVTDFTNGLVPDINIEENLFYPLGDIDEILLATALNVIVPKTSPMPVAKSATIKHGKAISRMQSHPSKIRDIMFTTDIMGN